MGYRSVIGYQDGTAEGIRLYGDTYGSANYEQREARKRVGLIGRGAYAAAESGGSRVLSNDLMGGGAVPSFGEGGSIGGAEGSLTIRHAEYIGNILGNSYVSGSSGPVNQFQNTTFAINPALETTFPWLSQVAQNYDEYTMISCVYTYRTMVTDFAANSGQVGQVYMAAQYNNNDTPFQTTRAFLDYASAVSGKTSQTIMMGLECDPSKISMPGGKYTRTGPALPGVDLNTLDSGILNIAVVGTPESYANQIMGQLWVSYVVQVRKPKSFVNQCLGVPKDIFITDTIDWQTNYPWVQAGPSSGFPMSPAPIAYGQQNRIGVKFIGPNGQSSQPWTGVTDDGNSPAVVNFAIQFPESAVGTYEVILNTVSNSARWPSTVDILNPFPIPSSSAGFSYAGSGVSPVNDLWQPAAAPGDGDWSFFQVSKSNHVVQTAVPAYAASTLGCNPDGLTLMGHFNIVPTSDGSINSVNFSLFVPSCVAATFFELFAFQVQVTEYNRGLNNQLTGQPLLVDGSGTAIAAPPTVPIAPATAVAAAQRRALASSIVREVAAPSPRALPAKRARKKVTVKDLKEDLDLDIPE